MTSYPKKNLAHLDSKYPSWVVLIEDLIRLGIENERFVILESDLNSEQLVAKMKNSIALYADFLIEPGIGSHSLFIIYQIDAIENDRYLQLASGRYMVEISLDVSGNLIDIRLALFDSEAAGLPFPLKPMSNDRTAMLKFLSTGSSLPIIELP